MMNAQQKHAWFNLVVFVVAVVLAAIALPAVGFPGFAVFGLLGLWGFAGLFYLNRQGKKEVVLDERDAQINSRAWLVAWSVVWLYWGALCMGPWFWTAFAHGLDAPETSVVRVSWLPLVYMSAMMVGMVAWSIAVLVQYRSGKTGCED